MLKSIWEEYSTETGDETSEKRSLWVGRMIFNTVEEDIWKIQSNSSVSEGFFLGVRGASAETEEDLTKRKL